jgi:hypothetical protein
MIWDDAMGRKPWVHPRGSTSEVTSEAKFGTRSFRGMETLVWRRRRWLTWDTEESPKTMLLVAGKPLIDTSIKITQCKEIWFLHFFPYPNLLQQLLMHDSCGNFLPIIPISQLSQCLIVPNDNLPRGHRRSFKGSTWRLHPPFDVTWWQLYDSVKWTFSQTGS